MNDRQLNASVLVNLDGNLRAQAARNEQALQSMSRNGARHLTGLQRATATLDSGLTRLGNRWVALASGGSVTVASRNVVALQERITKLGIAANISDYKLAQLKDQMLATANLQSIRIDSSELIASVEEIIEKTGDLKFAQDNLENLAMTIAATAAEGKSIGGIAAEFQKMGIIDPKDVREALDILITQGKEGAFTLRDLAALGPRVVTSYTSMGRGGVQAIREMGSALQVIRQATGNSEQAATSFEALMRVLSDAQKVKALQRGGIQIFDPEQLKQGKEVLRPINALMVEIVKATKGRSTLLSEVIGDAEALRAFKAVATEFNLEGEVTSLQKFMDVMADGSNLTLDSARNSQTAAGALRALSNSAERVADLKLAAPIQELADAINSLDGDQLNNVMDTITDVALAIGGAAIGWKVLRGGQRLAGATKGGAGDVLSQAAGMSAAPIPVFVVNSMGGLSGDVSQHGQRRGRAQVEALKHKKGMAGVSGDMLDTPKGGRFSRVAGAAMVGAGWAGGLLGSGMVGYSIGTIINETMIEGTAVGDAIGEAVAYALAAFGSKDAQNAISTSNKLNPSRGDTYEEMLDKQIRVELGLTPEASKALKVTHTKNKSDADLAVTGSIGSSMGLMY